MESELIAHAKAHEENTDVGEQPTRVTDNLEDRGALVFGEGSLIEGEPRVAERVIHVDQSLGVAIRVEGVNDDFAGEVEGDLSAGIPVVGEIDQFDFKGVVVTLEAKGYLPGLIA